MRCPHCVTGFTYRERMGFSWLSWRRCVNCGWHGAWGGRDPERLPDALESLVREIAYETRTRAVNRARRIDGYEGL